MPFAVQSNQTQVLAPATYDYDDPMTLMATTNTCRLFQLPDKML